MSRLCLTGKCSPATLSVAEANSAQVESSPHCLCKNRVMLCNLRIDKDGSLCCNGHPIAKAHALAPLQGKIQCHNMPSLQRGVPQNHIWRASWIFNDTNISTPWVSHQSQSLRKFWQILPLHSLQEELVERKVHRRWERAHELKHSGFIGLTLLQIFCWFETKCAT